MISPANLFDFYSFLTHFNINVKLKHVVVFLHFSFNDTYATLEQFPTWAMVMSMVPTQSSINTVFLSKHLNSVRSSKGSNKKNLLNQEKRRLESKLRVCIFYIHTNKEKGEKYKNTQKEQRAVKIL